MGKLGLFIFRRDLRCFDNSALNALATSVDSIAPIFIFDPRQIESHPYKSPRGLTFLKESLTELSQSLQENFKAPLTIYLGKAESVIEELIERYSPHVIAFNNDYTPFSKKRDSAIIRLAQSRNIPLITEDDSYLLRPHQILTGAQKPYTIFTPFYKRGLKEPIIEPSTSMKLKQLAFTSLPLSSTITLNHSVLESPPLIDDSYNGGRTRALAILEEIHRYKNYSETRDIPSVQGTTRLSAHLKFGTVSAREVRTAIASSFNEEHPLIRQLFWRDFYGHIAAHFPHVYGHAFNKSYSSLPWNDDEGMFKRWCEGTTGFPIVDAGMRELNETGFMHNRLRMITASFLIKDLHINWMWGERYFATKLIDYDPAVNNGNWQWVASTGCDAAPYFRVFNPWLQGERFDPDGSYIRRWVKELETVPSVILHDPQATRPQSYPRPTVDHKIESQRTISMYKQSR